MEGDFPSLRPSAHGKAVVTRSLFRSDVRNVCDDERDDAVFQQASSRSQERPILSQPTWQSGEVGFLGGTVMWLYAEFSGEKTAYGDVLTMGVTRVGNTHRRFFFCYAEVLADCNEETSGRTRQLLQVTP